MPPAARWSESEHLAFEKEALGLYWSGHPVDRFVSALKHVGACSIADLNNSEEGAPKPGDDISVGGIVSAWRPLKTRKGERMAVVTLEDRHASIEVVVFPDAYSKSSALIESGTLILVKGRFERDEESRRLLVSEIRPLEEVQALAIKEVGIRLALPPHGRSTFEALSDVFARHRGDRRVFFELELRRERTPLRVRAELTTEIRIKPSDRLVAELERICGSGSVSLR